MLCITASWVRPYIRPAVPTLCAGSLLLPPCLPSLLSSSFSPLFPRKWGELTISPGLAHTPHTAFTGGLPSPNGVKSPVPGSVISSAPCPAALLLRPLPRTQPRLTAGRSPGKCSVIPAEVHLGGVTATADVTWKTIIIHTPIWSGKECTFSFSSWNEN